ncbi:MAG: carbohydrate-binding protein [Pseudomonadota bacterium]|nr:carbohydrate-binding protein [Pseudomonadota bacterium]
MATRDDPFVRIGLDEDGARMLAVSRGALQPAIRSIPFGLARFELHGRSLAAAQQIAQAGQGGVSFFPRLRENVALLADSRALLDRHSRLGHHLTPAAGWLIDNGTLLDQQLAAIQQGLPRSYFRKLPKLRDPPLAGLPRIYGIAWAWVAHADSGLDEHLLESFLSAYQSVAELTLAELWAIATTLRVVLIENLRRLAERAASAQAARDAAHRLVERDPQTLTAELLQQLGQILSRRGVLEAFALQLQRRTADWPASQVLAWRAWLAEHLPDPVAALQREQQTQAEDHHSVRNAVTALRELDHVEWRAMFMRSNPMLAQLQGLAVFAAEADLTQDQSLHRIERMAARARVAESQVGQAVFDLASNAANRFDDSNAAYPTGPGSAPLYWLRGVGRPALKHALGLTDTDWVDRARSAARRSATPLYLSVLAFASMALVLVVLNHDHGLPWWSGPARGAGWLTAWLMLWPASEAIVALLNRLLSEGIAPRPLPRLALANGISADQRVLLVMPVMLTGSRSIAALVAQLEQHQIANPEPQAQFALLSDWVDAAHEHETTDDALLQTAQQGVNALNHRHAVAPGEPLRFLLLHRGRRWSDSEQRWIGWERKRGKLEALIAWVAGSGQSPFFDLQALSQPADETRRVLTLDGDTVLPPGRLRELVAIAAHPLNLPRLDDRKRRVRAGYAILQPRVVVPLPTPGTVTPFYWLFSGQWGVDAYSVASSEVYQDLFAEGTFTGKGLLDVATLNTLLCGRLPESQVLSHDLLEGALTRCATVSDVTVVEDAPAHPDVAASRVHRWTRGDWQLLPFLLQPRRWPMRGINRWKLFDNLRRSLVAPMSLLLVVWALCSPALSIGTAVWLTAAAYGAGPLLGAVAALAPARDNIALGLFYRRTGTEVLRALLGTVWHLLLLLMQAMLGADAIVRAAVRQFVSRRLLLQWTTAAAAQAAAGTRLASLLRVHARVCFAALALAALALGLHASGQPVALPAAVWIALAWAATPLWIWFACLRVPAATERLDERRRETVRQLAVDTWQYYVRYVVTTDHDLPPDNVQMTGPEPMVAHRTSPTNIGLYLLATATAQELGLLSATEMADRLQRTLRTLDRLPRWHGHFYNWYDTQSLAVLAPPYVSAVDSGNLSGHLLVMAAACETCAMGEAELAGRLQQIAVHARSLALGADFKTLYDRRRHLLHIGWATERNEPDASHYDLLASESRMASLVGIAKGDLPPRHWAALGRPVFAGVGDGAGGRGVGLKSWSGSMFEYLMPTLVLDEPAGSLLYDATRTAVAMQQREGRLHGLPWGVSESAIAVQDHTLAYQYGPHGTASLALRRTPADERVVAPYASAMALMVAPRAAADNLALLAERGTRRDLGFIEALDYTPRRQRVDDAEPFTAVETFMAHHQAMSLLACAHVLTGGAVQRWAAQDPYLRAVLPLLQERTPHQVPRLHEQALEPQPASRDQRWQFNCVPQRQSLVPMHLLGNEHYAVALNADGAGFSVWNGQAVTRWRDDALQDNHGLFGYVRRVGSETASRTGSAGSADGPRSGNLRPDWLPLAARPAGLDEHSDHGSDLHDRGAASRATYQTDFHPDRVLLKARWSDLEATTTVSVSARDDCELRRVELRNCGHKPLRLQVALAFEAVLAPQAADEAHPAFSNLFIEARWSAAERALYLHRKPRLAHEPAMHAVFFLASCDDLGARVQACADRSAWLGRLGNVAEPLGEPFLAATSSPESAGEADEACEMATGLDPAGVLSVVLSVPPGTSRHLSFVLGCAAEIGTLRSLVDRYREPAAPRLHLGLSDTLARIRLREVRLDLDGWIAWLHLNALLSNIVTRPAPAEGSWSSDTIDRRVLWRHGISGERPLLLLWVQTSAGLDTARQIVGMLSLWTTAGQGVEIVIVNAEPDSYLSPVRDGFTSLAELAAMRVDPQIPVNRRASLHLLPARELSAADQGALRALARVTLHADGRPLAQLVDRLRAGHDAAFEARLKVSRSALRTMPPRAAAKSPRGSFDRSDASFHFEIDALRYPRRPWVNVLANSGFGTQVSEAAAGFTWAGNSRQHQITAWSNDPLCDPSSEALWLQDLDTLQVWWLGRGIEGDARSVTQGIGWTRIRQQIDGLDVQLQWCVDSEAAVKQLSVRLRRLPGASARPGRARQLRLVGYAEWTLGASRRDRCTVATRAWRFQQAQDQRLAPGLALMATQRDAGGDHAGATAFLCWRAEADAGPAAARDAGQPPDLPDWSCDRRELHDSRGRISLPERLLGTEGIGLDPCAAIGRRVRIAPGEEAHLHLLLGHADSPEAAERLVQRACAKPPAERLAQQTEQWPALFDAVSVHTPDPLFDALVNRWLPYQAVGCRIWGRAGFYQAGGAFGFRDQLQDAMNLANRAPELLAHQIRLHAARQFIEGDVQHWWHPPTGAGVRTHMSDDLLWLPLALAHSVRCSGDAMLLDESQPFLRSPPVPEGKEDLYSIPDVTDESATLYEHGARAIDHSLRTGDHGLPLMGTGDWNDGMNRVGHLGRGESVWLGWFLCQVIAEYAPLAESRGEVARATRWRAARAALVVALDRDGWDGAWYRRAFFDDGSPLGSASNRECRIDLIAQSWAVLSGAGDPHRARQAMASAQQLLWDPGLRLLKLLDPPLAQADPSAGYIQAYPEGIRENGGQYNHAAVWGLMAFAELGDAAAAWRTFKGLSPAHRNAEDATHEAYELEPYVAAGDIYSQPPYAGRGGWSWYTGSASWLQRAAIESICGVRLEGRQLTLHPCLPPHWNRIDVELRLDGRKQALRICRDAAAAAEGGPWQRVQAGEVIDLEQVDDERALLLIWPSANPA